MQASIQAIGNWDKQVGAGLEDALRASIEIVGKTGEKACRTALYFMAQSAQKMTPISKEKRDVTGNPEFAHLMKKSQYKAARMAGKNMARYYRHKAWKLLQSTYPHEKAIYANQPERIAKIKGRGLGVRSWQWGLARLGGKSPRRRPIPGVSDVYTIYRGSDAGPLLSQLQSGSVCGYMLRNRLTYIMKIMPAGWEKRVETLAANRIMGEARNTLRRRWASDMKAMRPYGTMKQFMRTVSTASNRQLADYFTRLS